MLSGERAIRQQDVAAVARYRLLKYGRPIFPRKEPNVVYNGEYGYAEIPGNDSNGNETEQDSRSFIQIVPSAGSSTTGSFHPHRLENKTSDALLQDR